VLREDGRKLELHLVGHSAGAILLGHLLERLGADGPKVRTCTLFAPACSMSFATRYYLPAADAGLIDLERLWIHYLSDANEKRDGVPSPEVPAYGKSLLYLVSRALDDVRKMPLLGLERALDPAFAADAEQWAGSELPFIREWQSKWDGTRLGIRVDTSGATHGSFDEDAGTVAATLQRIRGAKLVSNP
jgi:pimeloyl-ACP methyl ester carboxylesterase